MIYQRIAEVEEFEKQFVPPKADLAEGKVGQAGLEIRIAVRDRRIGPGI